MRMYKTMIALTFEAPDEAMLPTIGDVKEYLLKLKSGQKLTWHGWEVSISQMPTCGAGVAQSRIRIT